MRKVNCRVTRYVTVCCESTLLIPTNASEIKPNQVYLSSERAELCLLSLRIRTKTFLHHIKYYFNELYISPILPNPMYMSPKISRLLL